MSLTNINTCVFCSLPILPGEKRLPMASGDRFCHMDCAVDFEHDRDKETYGA
jgi:ribosomal protein L24E